MFIRHWGRVCFLDVCFLSYSYSCQSSFIKIIPLSSAVDVWCVCVSQCGSSLVGGLACLLLRCYNLPGSSGTIISSMSFFLPPPPPLNLVHSATQLVPGSLYANAVSVWAFDCMCVYVCVAHVSESDFLWVYWSVVYCLLRHVFISRSG